MRHRSFCTPTRTCGPQCRSRNRWAAAAVRPTTGPTRPTDRRRTMDADVIVIGAGISGALVADRLAASGVRVLMLEAGPRVEREHAVVAFFNAAVKVPECAYPNTAYAPHPRSDNPDFYYVQTGA